MSILKPQTCKSCGAMEFIEQNDAYVCAYCDTRYPRTKQISQPVQPPVQPPTAAPSPVQKATRQKNKWVALLLCVFFGFFGAHKFYEGKIGMGLLYFFTEGLLTIGWVVDIFILLFKPNPYYV